MEMNKILQKAIAAVAIAAAPAIMLQGCDEGENGNDSVIATLYDVVELKEQTAEATEFLLYRPDADEAVTLTTGRPVFSASDEIEAGDCVFMAYMPDNGMSYASGTVKVRAWGRVNNGVLLKGAPESLDGWNADPVWLMSLWRAGGKVVVRSMLTYDTEPRQFALMIDETTVSEEYPDAYLVHKRRSDRPNFKRQYYSAFDVSDLWSCATCKGLRIHVNNSNLPQANVFTVENPRANK